MKKLPNKIWIREVAAKRLEARLKCITANVYKVPPAHDKGHYIGYVNLSDIWHDARKDRPSNMQNCLCYDKFEKKFRTLIYDDNSKYWCDLFGKHISDYGDFRITMWADVESFTPLMTI